MRKIFLLLLIITLSFGTALAEIVDDSIIKELEKQEVRDFDVDFKLKTFQSCEGLEKIMGDYVKDYWGSNMQKWNSPRFSKGVREPFFTQDMEIMGTQVTTSTDDGNLSKKSSDYSKTNTQVDGVDESDIVKTDGKYIYYYNETDKYVYIIESKKLEIIKKIKLPSNFNRPVLYIGDKTLTIISSGYSDINYSKMGYWINRNSKTYTIVFDTTNIKKPILSKLYISDGDLIKTRKIGDYIYIISSNNFNIPYYTFKTEDDIKLNIEKLLPTKIDISKTDTKEDQNLKFRGKKLPYNIKSGKIAKCDEIEYILPDAETIKKYDFNPSYNIISVINTKDTSEEVKTKVIAGSNAELYMSVDNMYLTSNMYQSYDFRCSGGLNCIMPFYSRGANTLIHKMNIDKNKISYQGSTLVPGSPLTQYSMDEYKGDFRILTSTNTWGENRKQHTNLYILDKDLELKGSLTGLGKDENFKSSRYMGDKLYLVTFKDIDPFFVIDVSDSSNPKVLGELKIPGYSTYLHPYDENNIIGLGYDTIENKWGGTMNGGLKIDLYDVSDFENPKQKFSYTLGSNGSYSEALTNPRMFMWKASEKKLFLPATLYKSSKEDIYRYTDFFQGLITLNIDKDTGIKEDFRITHMETENLEKERKKECSKYSSKKNTEPKCYELINGDKYCEPVRVQYVPKYCYADSSIGEYMASKSWNYRSSFIKRALWIDNNLFSISDDFFKTSNIKTGKETDILKIGK